MVLTACAARGKQPASTAPVDSHEAPQAPIEFDESGAPFERVWTRPAETGPAARGPGPALRVSALGQSSNAYRLQLQLKPIAANDPRVGQREAPTLVLSVDGCQTETAPPFTGLIEFGGPPSALTIARSQLPMGALRLIVRAHGQETSIDLIHDASGLRPITASDAAGSKQVRAACP
jgi:hypothetical protein